MVPLSSFYFASQIKYELLQKHLSPHLFIMQAQGKGGIQQSWQEEREKLCRRLRRGERDRGEEGRQTEGVH